MSKQNMSSSRLLEKIKAMMTDVEQAADERKIEALMRDIRNMPLDKASDQLRLASCHFMTMFHTRKAMTIGMPQDGSAGPNPMAMMGGPPPGGPGGPGGPNAALDVAAVEEFKKAQRDDMELGWRLLDGVRGGNSQEARTARVLKIEVAQRLEDSQKLSGAFRDLMARNLTEEEIMVAFTAAPFLGDWKAMMRLGQRIERQPGGMEQLHLMSLQLPIPDFTLIYALAKEYNLHRQKSPRIDQLKWDLYTVEKIRVKFKDVECGKFRENRKELLDEIHKQGDVQWEEVPNTSHVHVKRMGALCQAVSFGEIPMMLNGPWFDKEIHVRGRAEMPLMPEGAGGMGMGGMGMGGMPSPDQMTILVQEEEWILKRDEANPRMYKGTYFLKQRPELPPGKKVTKDHAPVNMTFECEVHLKEPANGAAGEDSKRDDGDEKRDDAVGNANSGAAASSSSSAAGSAGRTRFADDDEAIESHLEEEDGQAAVNAVVTEFDDLELD